MCELLAETDRGATPSDRALFEQLCVTRSPGACVALGWLVQDDDGLRAAALFERACAALDERGCTSLAEIYEHGRAVTRDEPRAVSVYKRACEAGFVTACAGLAAMMEDGRGTAVDPTSAAALYDKACAGGVSEGCSGYGWALLEGRGVAKDETRAVDVLGQGCNARSLRACQGLGRALAMGAGLPKNEVRAVEILKRGCDKGHDASCRELATVLVTAAPPVRDETSALVLFERACEHTDGIACGEAGKLVSEGRGATSDWKRAATFWDKGCAASDAQSCYRLGLTKLRGRGAPVDGASALPLFAKACDRGDDGACNELGEMLTLGTYAARDADHAESCFRSSCERGSAIGCLHLGVAYKDRSVEGAVSDLHLGLASKDCRHTALACDWLGRLSESESTTAGFSALFDLCNDRVPAACEALARAVSSGRVAKDTVARRFARIHAECERGQALWCRRLAYWHEEGLGVAKNAATARRYYGKACDEQDAHACSDFARMMAIGSGGPKDTTRAVTLLRATCAVGGEGITACGHLGMIYVNEGTPARHDEGTKLLERACDGGDALACHRLGGFFANGAKGFAHDDRRAVALLERACTLGGHACEQAKRLRDALATE